jgi:poly(beta-D-mannuronate) lyase
MSIIQRILCCILVVMIAAPALAAREILVTNPQEFRNARKDARPGDHIVLRDGQWRDADLRIELEGAEGSPITIRPQTPGKVHLTGESRLRIGGRHIIVDGLVFRDGGVSSGHVIATRDGDNVGAEHVTLRNIAIIDYNPPAPPENSTFWISLYGRNNIVERTYTRGKNTLGPTLVVWVGDQPDRHIIRRNFFDGRPPLGTNGGETIRIGTSQVSMNESLTRVEENLFVNCDGESEIISNKSVGNIYRANTFIECRGGLVLRHGNRCTVEGNFFFGNDKPGTGGIRIIGEDHVIINNYLERLAGSHFESAMPWVNGIPDSALNEYFRIQRAVVAFNTFVECHQSMTFGAGVGTRNRIEQPLDSIVANNIIVSRHGPLIHMLDEPINTTWVGNILWGAEPGVADREGIRIIDPKLIRGEDGLYRPAADSPAIGAAAGDFPSVTHDLLGRPRTGRRDIGAIQQTDAPAARRPMTPAEVLPHWMEQ